MAIQRFTHSDCRSTGREETALAAAGRKVPVYTGVGGTISSALEIVGLTVSTAVRPPLIPVEPEHYRQLEFIHRTTFERYPPSAADGSFNPHPEEDVRH